MCLSGSFIFLASLHSITVQKFCFFGRFFLFFEFVSLITPLQIELGTWKLVCTFRNGFRCAFWRSQYLSPHHYLWEKSRYFFIQLKISHKPLTPPLILNFFTKKILHHISYSSYFGANQKSLAFLDKKLKIFENNLRFLEKYE